MNLPKAFLLTFFCIINVLLPSFADGIDATPNTGQAINWNEAQINWHSYDEGTALLKRNPKARGLFIIYADWCPTCRKYSTLFSTPSVVTALNESGLILIKANADQNADLNLVYSPDGEYIPRTFVLDSNAEIIQAFHPKRSRYRYFLNALQPQAFINYIQRIRTTAPAGFD